MKKPENDLIDYYSNFFKYEQIKIDIENLNLKCNDKKPVVNNEEVVFLWDRLEFPNTWYQEKLMEGKKKNMYKNKIELSREIDLYQIKPKKLAKILTGIDFSIIMKIRPHELVEYDGTNCECVNLNHIKHKNIGLTNFVANELMLKENYIYFFRLLKHLKAMKNYNSFFCVIRAFQNQKLATKDLKNVSKFMKKTETYFDMRNVLDQLIAKNEMFIYPIDVYMKDVEDSNRSKSEASCMRFCSLVEMLIKLQNGEEKIEIKHRYEHFILDRLYTFYKASPREFKKVIRKKYHTEFLLIDTILENDN